MKNKQKILLSAIVLMLGVGGMYAQKMHLFVHSGGNAPQSFALSNIDKITFQGNTMNVLPKNDFGSNIALSAVSRLTFAVVLDTVPPPIDTVPPPIDTVPPPVDTVPPPIDTVPPPSKMHLFVHSDGNAPRSFALSGIDKVTFQGNTMNLLPKSGFGSNIALSAISRLTFAVVTDTVPPPVDTLPPPVDTVPPPIDTVPPPIDTVPPPLPPTGVDAVDVSTLEVFPNPVRDELLITSDTEIEAIVVFDLSGNMLLRRNVQSYTATLSLGFLPAGAYLIQVRRADAISNHKIIKL
jgi:hypothetical protein